MATASPTTTTGALFQNTHLTHKRRPFSSHFSKFMFVLSLSWETLGFIGKLHALTKAESFSSAGERASHMSSRRMCRG